MNDHAPDIEMKDLEEYEWTNDPAEKGKGKIYVDELGTSSAKAYCPHSGEILQADACNSW